MQHAKMQQEKKTTKRHRLTMELSPIVLGRIHVILFQFNLRNILKPSLLVLKESFSVTRETRKGNVEQEKDCVRDQQDRVFLSNSENQSRILHANFSLSMNPSPKRVHTNVNTVKC